MAHDLYGRYMPDNGLSRFGAEAMVAPNLVTPQPIVASTFPAESWRAGSLTAWSRTVTLIVPGAVAVYVMQYASDNYDHPYLLNTPTSIDQDGPGGRMNLGGSLVQHTDTDTWKVRTKSIYPTAIGGNVNVNVARLVVTAYYPDGSSITFPKFTIGSKGQTKTLNPSMGTPNIGTSSTDTIVNTAINDIDTVANGGTIDGGSSDASMSTASKVGLAIGGLAILGGLVWYATKDASPAIVPQAGAANYFGGGYGTYGW